MGAIPASALAGIRDGRKASVGGVVLVRQRPGTAKGVVFLTIEDETGIANAVLWRTIFEAQRATAMGARLLLIHGRVQRGTEAEGGVTHLVAERLEDLTAMLDDLDCRIRDEIKAPQGSRRHPRDVRIIPVSRDFH
jgi:error-prone DNA polymerase